MENKFVNISLRPSLRISIDGAQTLCNPIGFAVKKRNFQLNLLNVKIGLLK